MKNIRKYLKKTFYENKDILAIYLFGKTHDEDDGEHYFADYFKYEFEEYINSISAVIEEVMINQQVELTVEFLLFILDYEAIGITCKKHSHANKPEVINLLTNILTDIKLLN